MPQVTIGIGSVLSLLGIGAYLGASRKHITALIPTFIGLPLSLLGVVARQEKLSENATRGEVGLSLLGFLVSLQGLFFPELFPATYVSADEHPKRGAAQAIMAALCGLHFGMTVGSLIEARRRDLD